MPLDNDFPAGFYVTPGTVLAPVRNWLRETGG